MDRAMLQSAIAALYASRDSLLSIQAQAKGGAFQQAATGDMLRDVAITCGHAASLVEVALEELASMEPYERKEGAEKGDAEDGDRLRSLLYRERSWLDRMGVYLGELAAMNVDERQEELFRASVAAKNAAMLIDRAICLVDRKPRAVREPSGD